MKEDLFWPVSRCKEDPEGASDLIHELFNDTRRVSRKNDDFLEEVQLMKKRVGIAHRQLSMLLQGGKE